ncbi:MAG: ATP-binding cassette domain-containing protein [Polyangiaceae bacterium]|nr:ATP-binding cassette domain-containing protein [Myxococcales bacterium]MCB9587502.1 ATP-binding cassette domain-containing protein [Polyangiaceae bacterium]MCB9605701.1 ATP-binding cassette domain-containing protein [Polyangiaceae bacterium]
MITVSEVSMNFGEQVLFDNVNVTFNEGERYGLTGPNGAGKSTFMRIVTGEQEAMAGNVRRPKRVGILRQDHYQFEENRVIDVVLMGNDNLWKAMHEKETLLEKGDALTDEDGMRLGELEGVIAEEDGYMAEAEATELLEGLGIPEKFHAGKMSALTGGDKVRVLLAQSLFGKPDALLLDEPTNALDIASIRWLEGFLLDYRGVLVVISHDRHFLNEVCTRIADIDYQTIIVYPGNYDDMVHQKAEARGSLELQNSAKQKKIQDLQEFVQRFRAGSRASQVKSREKALEREKQALSDLKRSNIERPWLRFELKRPSGKQALGVEGLTKSFGEISICDNLNFSLFRGDKVAVVGPNGVGKTTLLKMLVDEVKADSGKIEWGYEASVGYMPQDHHEQIEKSDVTAHKWLWGWAEEADEEQIRAMFGRLLFKKDEPFKPTKVLSGGETVRLLLARLMLLKPNILLLDEPTNHLDLESIRSLTDALVSYEGSCMFVTHDRQMVSTVADRILELSEDGVRELTPQQFMEGDFLTKHKTYQKPGW